MDLSHYTSEPLGAIRSVQQPEKQSFKPVGFWVSVDGPDDWPAWCRGENYGLGAQRYRVVLDGSPLVLSTVDQVLEFTETYGLGDMRIDWIRLARDWPGIIIAPYQWSLRLHHLTGWYYCWDCASGCIWDASIVKSVEYAGPSEQGDSPST